ncbi:XRE family transcriptional regulator [Actinorhabdospora filicis]|uniref:XRE family transcriptional regulator n=1 Tax=Actinorhabdospora filicis TaxID=1785913 RepID=A0A9W6STI5_9ACTN|nr:helix-turn-helix transcriptional regulator [Actinorhabdospora filicis]GLZ82077.1 XRE family transcriptional regulator [Actinorhabdospora filicis]
MTVGTEIARWRTSRRLSQLELAARAGTTQRHVSFVESGRSKPGRAMLLRLAESMQLTLRERNALLYNAGFAPVYTETPLDAPELRPVHDALRRIIEGHMPYPAVVSDPRGELIAANAAVAAIIAEDVAPELMGNVYRVALHPDGMPRRVLNLAEWGRHVIDGLRMRALRSPDPVLDALIAELAPYVPDAPTGPDHMGFGVPLRLMHRGTELRLLTTLTSFATAVDVTVSELHLEAFLPADEETAAALRLSAGSAG